MSRSSLKDTIADFQNKADLNENKLKNNPFSDKFQNQKRTLGEEGYGRPEKGSATERRGIKAGNQVSKEILALCEFIHLSGDKNDDETVETTFGQLFKLYTRISDKVVGMLIRARKHGLVSFEGEMLYQKQDDDKVIKLLKPIEEIKASLAHSGDPERCINIKK